MDNTPTPGAPDDPRAARSQQVGPFTAERCTDRAARLLLSAENAASAKETARLVMLAAGWRELGAALRRT